MRSFKKKILSILFFVFIVSNFNFANLSAGWLWDTVDNLLNRLHLRKDEPIEKIEKKIDQIGYELLKDLPIDIWDAEIINFHEKSLSERELLGNTCLFAQILLLGNEAWHRNLADKFIKHIISLDRQVNTEGGLVDFYQILDCVYEFLKNHPELRFQRKKFCCDKRNTKCLFCQLIKERKLYDRNDVIMPRSTLIDLNEAFIRSAKEGNLNLLKMLLLHGVDINTVDKDGETALHWAAYNGKFNVTAFLTRNGSGLSLQDAAGRTPLMIAIYKGHIDLANFLTDFCNKSIINIINSDQNSALLFAIGRNALFLTEKLLKKGAKKNVCNILAQTPRSLAVSTNDDKMIKLLKKYGVNF
ncbi:ankyrin repeat domain-containing protein [Candidatus Babeliales bacterium]|nr:ankyrin repeat domain-containing protein [Candidatus Babeliales bacterium]MCF7899080.1 ankyrin repeat domain-containing protein [Candidatus Babeliales bacterium]